MTEQASVVLREIALAETAAADALPCDETVVDDGWRLRFNGHVTRRCNSVLAQDAGTDGLEPKIARAERFYRARDARTRFQLSEASQPTGLEVALAGRGYERTSGALVLSAAVGDVPPVDGDVRLESAVSESWLSGLAEGSREDPGALEVRRRTLARLQLPAAFARLDLDGRIAAVGLGVLSGAYLVLFNMATVPAFRRRGAARRVVAALSSWAQEAGASRAILQVAPGNGAARALYAASGFRDHHVYDYWQAPEG